MEKLIGKKITGIKLYDEGNVGIGFVTERTEFKFKCEGDCCSETYIAELIGVKNLIGHEIKEIEQMDLGRDEFKTKQDIDTIYGWKIRNTKNGIFLLIFRNSSNGYYGGSLEECDSFGDKIKSINITADWNAD